MRLNSYFCKVRAGSRKSPHPCASLAASLSVATLWDFHSRQPPFVPYNDESPAPAAIVPLCIGGCGMPGLHLGRRSTLHSPFRASFLAFFLIDIKLFLKAPTGILFVSFAS
jgi:hypothetical protein